MKARLVTMSLVFATLISFNPAPVTAYSWSDRWWPGNPATIYYCFESAPWPSGFIGAITTGLEDWDVQSSGIDMQLVSWPCDIEIRWDALGATNVLSRTGLDLSTPPYILEAWIYFNASRPEDMTTSTATCYVQTLSSDWVGGIDCKAQVKTLAHHEVGHALGAYHLAGSGACYIGGAGTAVIANCPASKEMAMYQYADDGYARPLNSDDINGLRSVYGP